MSGAECLLPVFPDHPEWGPIHCNQEIGHDGPHVYIYAVKGEEFSIEAS